MKHVKFIFLGMLIFILIYCFSQEEETFILCLGDSITDSGWGNYPTHLNKMFLKNHIHCTAISRGRPGNTSGEYLRWFRKSEDLNKFKPKIAVLMLGTNDVRVDYDRTTVEQYRKNMEEIIGIIREFKKGREEKIDIYLCTIPPIFTPDLHTFTDESAQRVEKEIVPAILEMSVEHDLKLIDIHSMFKRNRDLLPGIHPSPGGYFKMAGTIFQQLQEGSPEYCSICKDDSCEVK